MTSNMKGLCNAADGWILQENAGQQGGNDGAMLAEQILPLVFSSGALYQFECGRNVPLVCKSWNASFRRCLDFFPSWAQVEVVFFPKLPSNREDMDQIYKKHPWVKEPKLQELITSHGFLHHVFEELEKERVSGVLGNMQNATWSECKKMLPQLQPVVLGVHIHRAFIHISEYPAKADDSLAIVCIKFRSFDRDIEGDIDGNRYCVLSKSFEFLTYFIRTANGCEDIRFNPPDTNISDIEDGRIIWDVATIATE